MCLNMQFLPSFLPFCPVCTSTPPEVMIWESTSHFQQIMKDFVSVLRYFGLVFNWPLDREVDGASSERNRSIHWSRSSQRGRRDGWVMWLLLISCRGQKLLEHWSNIVPQPCVFEDFCSSCDGFREWMSCQSQFCTLVYLFMKSFSFKSWNDVIHVFTVY